MSTLIEEAVERGEKWMDENGPADWRDRIDLDQLRIEDSSKCVLAQVWGHHGYQLGRQKLAYTTGHDTMVYGFNGDQRTTDAWKRRITAYREAHPRQSVPEPVTFPVEWAEIAHLHYQRIPDRCMTLVTGVC